MEIKNACKNRLAKDNSGAAVIEFALILPVLLLILLGVLEFGLWFLRDQVVQRTTTTAASAIQQDPTNPDTEADAYASGASFVDYTLTGNYICAKAYKLRDDAKANLCAAGDWATTTPTGVTAGTAYYVALVANVNQNSVTTMFSKYIPPIKITSVFKAGESNAAINFISPVVLATIPNNSAVGWTTISNLAADGVPSNASAVILSMLVHGSSVNGWNAYLYERASSSGPTYILGGIQTAGGGAPNLSNAPQGIFPVSVSGSTVSIDYKADSNLGSSTITLVGYIK